MIQIVAEIGTAHEGDLVKARELIEAAAEAGAGAVKFQLVIADEILHPLTGYVDLPGGRVDLYKRFKSLERPPEFYRYLKDAVEAAGMEFICSPFGIQSARILRDIGTRVFKVASPELNHFPLLRELASYEGRVILSSGVSTLGDIEAALRIVPMPILLHCVTSYPAPEEEYNLKVLSSLRRIFGIQVGVSDHSIDPVLVPVLSVLQGACVIEKHFTLDTTGDGLDDKIALGPDAFRRMVKEIRVAEAGKISGRIRNVLDALDSTYGKDRVISVLGDGVKRLAPSEAGNYAATNRTVHVLREIGVGEPLTADNTALLRSEKNLRPGLTPGMWDVLIGRCAVRKIPAGEGITFDDIGGGL